MTATSTDPTHSEAQTKALRMAISTLPPMAKLIMHLKLNGHSMRKIAARLEVPLSTVNYHYYSVALPLLRKRSPWAAELLGEEP